MTVICCSSGDCKVVEIVIIRFDIITKDMIIWMLYAFASV